MQGGPAPIIVGMLVHMMNSAIFGLLFGLVVGRRWSVPAALGLGLLWSVVLWAAMTWITLPIFDPTMQMAVLKTPGWWFFYHLCFGAGLLFTPILAAAFSGKPRGRATGAGTTPPGAGGRPPAARD
jgi:uncharacterized membrane protein YagU involved in acid resistance